MIVHDQSDATNLDVVITRDRGNIVDPLFLAISDKPREQRLAIDWHHGLWSINGDMPQLDTAARPDRKSTRLNSSHRT